MAKGSVILPLLPEQIDFELNSVSLGFVQNTAPTGVILLDTDLNPISPVSITQIGNQFEFVVATGSSVPSLVEINGVAFKSLNPGDTLDILIENSLLVPIGTPDPANNRVDIADATVLIQKSDSTLIFSFDIAAEDLDSYNVADSVIENSDASYTANVKATEWLILPDIDLSVNSFVEGSVPSVKDIDIEVEDSLSNPITPTNVTMVGDVLTIEVPSWSRDIFIKGIFKAGSDTMETLTIDSDSAGTYTSIADDGSSGSITLSKNGGAFAAFSSPLALVATDTLVAKRSTSTNAGFFKLTGTY
jgi:hypothetical protein